MSCSGLCSHHHADALGRGDKHDRSWQRPNAPGAPAVCDFIQHSSRQLPVGEAALTQGEHLFLLPPRPSALRPRERL